MSSAISDSSNDSMAKRHSRRRKGKASRSGRIRALRGSFAVLVITVVWAIAGVWYVHHPAKWLNRNREAWPRFVTAPLEAIGNPIGDLTDALGITGHDAVYEYDEAAPSGAVAFAGLPKRTGLPAPNDIVVLDRGEFKIGWSPKLGHPMWVAYHVPQKQSFEVGKRPPFSRDKSVISSPNSSAYDHSGYDRGHMAPNFALASRFGAEMQKQTFLMTNISPQKPALNQGVWRNVEHRIANYWTARWGEIWVVVGCIPGDDNLTIRDSGIDIPKAFFQVVVAQEGLNVRAFALLFPQNVTWHEWPTRYLITIDELEELCGLDFMPDLPEFIQSPLESELPSRLWPIALGDVINQIISNCQ